MGLRQTDARCLCVSHLVLAFFFYYFSKINSVDNIPSDLLDPPTAYSNRNAIKIATRVSDAGRNKFALFLSHKYVDLEGLRLSPSFTFTANSVQRSAE